jgi:opacity protein-like surface antigen
MVAGQVGIPLGRVRPYGQIGATYTWATLETRQTMTNVTENATQAYLLKTEGWGWTYGGGLEAWVTPSFALYGEGGFADLKGEAADGAEGTLGDRLTYIFVGARVRIGW